MNANFICGFGKSKLADAGIGHFKRCIILAKEFSVGKKEVNFLVYGEQTPLLNIDKEVNLQDMTARSFKNFLDEDDIKKLRMPSSDISFIDISNSFFIKHPDNLILLLTKIRKHSRLVILIDGLGKESIINNLNIKIPYDYLIVPYFGAENEFKHQENHLLGEDYFISEKNDEKYKKFKINKNATKICITCGGTDPERITIQVLESIVKIKGISMIRVVIGPNFSKDHIDSINSLIKAHNLIIKKIVSPESIVSHINWSDITIATSGLTKYEILKEGVPSIIIPFNSDQFLLNKASAEKNAFLTLSSGKIAIELSSVLTNFMKNNIKREEISKVALNLLDGKGTSRIISRVYKNDR